MATQISPHFTLEELSVTNHQEITNHASPAVIAQLGVLCRELLEPIRSRFGPLRVTSGYRCPELNAAVGGQPTSAHLYGSAADVEPMLRGVSVEDLIRFVVGSSLPYDQAIFETVPSGATWLHIAIQKPISAAPPRREALAYRDGVYFPYPPAKGAA